jgi:hypothetical protein
MGMEGITRVPAAVRPEHAVAIRQFTADAERFLCPEWRTTRYELASTVLADKEDTILIDCESMR